LFYSFGVTFKELSAMIYEKFSNKFLNNRAV